jgi:hypothetical protein
MTTDAIGILAQKPLNLLICPVSFAALAGIPYLCTLFDVKTGEPMFFFYPEEIGGPPPALVFRDLKRIHS